MLALLRFLVGVDRDLLARCPKRDRDNVYTIGWLLMGVWLWQLVVRSVALHVGLARPGEILPSFVALAALVATLVLLFDSYIVRASWLTTGMEQLSRAGLGLPSPWGTRIRAALFMVVRLGVTVLLALLTGSLMSLILFDKDVTGRLRAIAAAANAPLVSVAAGRFDAGTSRLATERDQALAVVQTGDTDAGALRRSVLRELEKDPEIAVLSERVRALIRAREAVERRLRQTRGQVSVDDAAGPARLAAAQRALAVAARDLAAAQERLRAEQARRENAAMRFTGTVDGRLKEIAAAREAAARRVVELDSMLAQRAAIREGSIREAVLRDPAYAPPDDGLLARLRVLAELTRDPFIFWVVVLLDAVFVAIELAAVLSKVMTFVPANYALLLVIGMVTEGQEAKEKLVAALKLEGPPGRDPTTVPAPVVVPAAGVPSAAAAAPPPPPDDEAEPAMPGGVGLDMRLSDGARSAKARQDALAAARSKPKANGSPPPTPPDGPVTDMDGPVRRGPGRPPGAKNRPKPEFVPSDAD